jgi:hypothetical protein
MELPYQPEEWAGDPAWPGMLAVVERAVRANRSRHPGIITEAIVDAIVESFVLTPREMVDRERRKNHPERIRRLSHAIFRILESPDEPSAAPRIAGLIMRSFIPSPRPAGDTEDRGR